MKIVRTTADGRDGGSLGQDGGLGLGDTGLLNGNGHGNSVYGHADGNGCGGGYAHGRGEGVDDAYPNGLLTPR